MFVQVARYDSKLANHECLFYHMDQTLG